jgi:hypothetical protein
VGYDVDAGAPNDVWVAADAVYPNSQNTPGLLLHWDGSSWEDVTPSSGPGTVVHIQSVDVAGPPDVWVGGSTFDTAARTSSPLVAHYDGSSWTLVPVSGPKPGAQAVVRSVRMVGDEMWALGYSRLEDVGAGGNDLPPFVTVCS